MWMTQEEGQATTGGGPNHGLRTESKATVRVQEALHCGGESLMLQGVRTRRQLCPPGSA